MAQVENHAALAGLPDKVKNAVVVVEHGRAHGVAVGVDVAGAVAGEQFWVRAGGFGREIDHDNAAGPPRRLNGSAGRFPSRSAKMGRLDPDDVLGIALDRGGAGDGVHIGGVLLGRAGHASADDVDKGEDAGDGLVHDGLFEICNILVPSTARIDASGDSVRQVVRVGEQPGIKAAVHVQMDVDEAGGDVEAGDIGLSFRGAG